VSESGTPAAWSSAEFEGDADDRAKAMLDEAIAVDQQQQTGFDLERDLDLMRMYEQRPVTDLLPYTGAFLTSHSPVMGTSAPVEVSPWNVLRAVVNTAHAMLARSKIRGRFLTTNGTQDQKRRAKAATQWLDGWSAEAELHEIAGQCLRDAEVCRFGVAALEEHDHRVTLERVMPGEIRFDYMSARNGKPKTIFRQRPMSKGVLLAKFPNMAATILAADTIATESGGTTDMVLVREAYSVKSSKKSDDGWHGIVIESKAGARLLMEKWEKTWHPYIFFIWERFLMGLGGTSLAAYLEPMQTELNHMQWVKRKARKLFGRPKIGVERGSNIVDAQLTNDIAGKIEFTNKPPVPLVWPYLPEQFFRDEDKLIANMYNFAGISQNASEGNKAPGAESGVAQREAMESQNLRLQVYAQTAWENPHVTIFNRAVEMAADIVAAGHSYEVEAEGQRGIEVLDFKKVIADLKKKKVTIYPTGFLPLTPAARLDFILKMLESQLWDVDRARAAMSDLDVDSEDTLENSIQRMFSTAFENMLYDGKAEHPDELAVGNYNVAIKTSAVYLAMAKIEKVDPKNVSLARRYVDELRELKLRAEGKKAPPVSAAPAPAPGPPQPVPPVGAQMTDAVAQGAAPPPMPS
jgi:hypothetical protein